MTVQHGGTTHLFAHISCPSMADTPAMSHVTSWWPRHASLCLPSPGAARATSSHTCRVPGPPPGGMGRSVHVPTTSHLHYVFILAVSQHPPRQPGYPGLDVGCIPALACCGTGSPSSSTTTWWQKHTSLPAYSALQCYIPCGSVATLVCTPIVSQQPGSKGMPVFHKGCVVW